MATIFTLLLLASLVLLIIGLTNPKKALFWKKKEQVSRTKAALFYIWSFAICLIGLIITIPDKTPEEKAKVAAAEAEGKYALARSCDTNYRFIDAPDKYLHQTGYFISYITTEGRYWYKKPWMASTYKQIGPSAFEVDKKQKLAIFQPLEVVSTMRGRAHDFDLDFFVVSPVGSSERYIISEHDITLKNVTSCTLLQKAKNDFTALAEYIPPADPNNRAIDETKRSWIDVPVGAIIRIKGYNKVDNTILGEIYHSDGNMMFPYARFKPETLIELNN